jgi:alpha-1,2-mannosyltransferase
MTSPDEAGAAIMKPAERSRLPSISALGLPDVPSRWRSRATLLLIFLSTGGALALAIGYATRHQIDFDIYRMGASNVLGQHLYDTRLPRALMGGSRGMHFTYPPFPAFLFLPFAPLPVSIGQVAWSVLNVLALAALIALSVHAVRPEWSLRRVWTSAAIALFPALLLNPDKLTLSLGQINFFIVLLVLADLTTVASWRSRTLPRGILVGIAAAVKLTPLIFIPFLLLTRQFRAGITALLTFLACSLAAFAIAPHSSWLYWSTEIFDAKRSGNLLYISNQDLHSALQRMLGAPPAPMLLLLLTAAFLAGGLAVATRSYRALSPMPGILVCAATGLIISPVSWAHHYVWVVPLLAWLTLGRDRPRGGRWWALGAAVLFWAAPLWSSRWIHDAQTGYGGPITILAGNSFFLAAVVFLLAMGAWLGWPVRRRPAVGDNGRPQLVPTKVNSGHYCANRSDIAAGFPWSPGDPGEG